MTSRNSLLKISRINFKKRFPFLVICFLICFFLMTVVTIFECIGIKENIEYYNIPGMPPGVIKNMAEKMLIGNGIFIVITAIEAILLAISGWSWNNTISKVDFYKSLPIKESKRFGYININNLFIFLITFGSNLVLSNIVIAVNGMYSVEAFTNSVFALITCTLAFIGLYTLAVIAELLTGNALLAVCFTALLWFYEPAFKFMIYFLKTCYYSSFYTRYTDDFLAFIGGITSPLASYFEVFANTLFSEVQADTNTVLAVIMLILQCVVYNYIAYVLYIKRKSYAGNSHIAFEIVKPVVKCMIMIPMLIAFMVAFTGILDIEKYDFMIAAFGLISGAVIGQIVLQYAFEGDFRYVVKGLKTLALSMVVAVVMFCFFRFDLSGYDKYIPSKDELKAVSICVPITRDTSNSIYGSNGVGISGEYFRLSNYEIEDENLKDEILKNVKLTLDENKDTPDMLGYPFNHTEYVYVCYTLNNGKKEYRQYRMDFDKCIDILEAAYASKEYRNTLNMLANDDFMAIVKKASDKSLIVRFEAHNTRQQNVKVDKADIARLFEAYNQDYAARPADTVLTKLPVMDLYINANDSEDADIYGRYSFASSTVPIYECDVNTLEIAKKYGIVPVKVKAEDISKIIVNKDVIVQNNSLDWYYDEYRGEFAPEDSLFNQILENADYASSFSSVAGSILREDEYYIEIRYNDGTSDSLAFYKGRVPTGLDEQLEKMGDSYDYGTIKEW